MQKFPDFVPAFSHHLKPLMRDGSQSTCLLFHPRIDGWIRSTAPLNRSNSVLLVAPLSAFEICGYVAALPSLQQNPPVWNSRSFRWSAAPG
jgi:hypothetical protein